MCENEQSRRGEAMFRILVVEDYKNLKKLIVTYLKRNSYIPYEASNGEEALEEKKPAIRSYLLAKDRTGI